jgi:PKD repeat protein
VSGGDVNSVGAGLIDANAALGGITPMPPQIISALSASGTVGQAFSYTIVATGSLPITYTTSALPTGLGQNGAIISGTPTLNGTFPVTLTATNSVGADSKLLVITIQPSTVTPPAITSALVATGTVGIPFSYTAIASGTLPITLTATGLPAWASFASPVISGTPTLSGTFPVTLTATNSGGSDSKTLVISILAGFKVYLPIVIR